MISERRIVVGGVLAGAVWLSGCADPCEDDGLLQQDNGDCPAATGAGTDSAGSDTDVMMDADGSGTAGSACDNGVQDGNETDVDCGGACDAGCGNGQGCEGDADCESGVCGEDGTCQPPTCEDGVQNGSETNVDCGGDACDPCMSGGMCDDGADCESGVCSEDGTCLPPACEDGVQNGDETDLDCGGSCGSTCEPGEDCLVFLDCVELVCDPDGNQCADPTCEDGAPNGNETDVDCGGPDCDPCSRPGNCGEDGDCASGVCVEGQCVPPECADGEQNGGETDVDCGGRDCAPCDAGSSCVEDGDCLSNNCDPDTMTCTAATCDDDVQNQGESDVDCGGPNCDACPNGGGCTQDSDCESGACDEATGTCEAPTCSDGMLNGDETAIDCGGPECPPCPDGITCADGSDCMSGVCDAGVCADPTCEDGVVNGLESDVDCGGDCPPCLENADCVLSSDCQSMVCLGETCQGAACDDGLQNGDESDVDCGGSCPACGDGFVCTDNADCESGVCDPDTMTCTPPACDDEVHNGDETDVDCGGMTCDPCGDGSGCVMDSDCVSMVCDPDTMTCTPPACDDGVLNGDETDLDCGGSECGATCDPGEDCLVDGDCVSMGCSTDTMTCNALLTVVAGPECAEYDGVTAVDITASASGGTGGPYSYAWTPDDGTIADPSAAMTSVTPNGITTYTVTADDGANTAQDAVTVVNSEPLNLQDNCTLFTAAFTNQPTASIDYDMDGTRACETGNNDFGLHLCTGVQFQDTQLVGTVEVTAPSGDNDWFGLVWGAQDESNFYSLVWKQGTQDVFGCSSPAGVLVKRIEAPNLASIVPEDIYCEPDTAQSTLLVAPSGATTAGWEETESYTVAIDYLTTGSTVTITRDSDAFELASFAVNDTTFASGFFGSTTLSQENACIGPLFAGCL